MQMPPAAAALSSNQTLLLVFGIIAITALLVAFFAFLIVRSLEKKNFRQLCGRRVYRVAMDFDYFLVNEFSFPTDDNNFLIIDHLLFGNRYIYCITDYYYKGVLSGEFDDASWIFYPKGKLSKKEIIKNPMLLNRKRIEKFALFTGLDPSLLISIVLVNNDCYIDDIEQVGKNEYIRNFKELSRLIDAIEKRPVERMDPLALEKAVQEIAKLRDAEKAKQK